jgi:hypothetical protein
MRLVEAYHKKRYGLPRGAKTWIANELGVSKQAITEFRNQGRFPNGYLPRIAQITGIDVEWLMGDSRGEVAAFAKRWNMSIRDAELVLIRAGLDNLS